MCDMGKKLKAQIHTLTDLCSKFRGKTASRLRDMARTNSRVKKKKKKKEERIMTKTIVFPFKKRGD